MGKKQDPIFIDAGTAETAPFEPSEEVQQEFEEAQRLGEGGAEKLRKELREHNSRTPDLSAGDIDADWRRADIGEETVGGSAPTPEQDTVEALGHAVGVTFEDNEPVLFEDKLEERDRHRWEMDPASSEDYKARVNHEGESKN